MPNPTALRNLYWRSGLSINNIAQKFGVSPPAVWYWMLKHKIPRREPKVVRKCSVPKELLEKLYVEQKMSASQVAKKLGLRSHSWVLQKLLEHGIPTRTLSQARTKYEKRPFGGSLRERAYQLGLRAGDLSAERNHNLIRVATSSTRAVQIEMVRAVFGKYGHVHIYPTEYESRPKEWRVYCDLDKSFDFLLEKPNEIPDWILRDELCFYLFLAGYVDSEGSFNVLRAPNDRIRVTLRIASEDRSILIQMKEKLRSLGFNPCFYLDRRKNSVAPYGSFKSDFYALWIFRRNDAMKLCKILLRLSQHYGKIWMMELILSTKGKSWTDIEKGVRELRRKIKTPPSLPPF